ncbi:MAG: hypothetical protein WCY10_04620 [Candidatus Omnitrophota bacterium]
MQIEIFSLCEAATADAGKLNVLGAFDTIWATKVPLVYPRCTIVLRARFEKIERGEHKVAVHFVDIDGKNVIPPAQGDLTMNFSDQQRSGSANLILNIQGIQLEKLGEYSIDLAIDGKQEASLPLYVKERPEFSNS